VVGFEVMLENAGVIVVFPAAVKRPFESTVKVPTCVAEPYDAAVTAVLASVSVMAVDPLPLASPVMLID